MQGVEAEVEVQEWTAPSLYPIPSKAISSAQYTGPRLNKTYSAHLFWRRLDVGGA